MTRRTLLRSIATAIYAGLAALVAIPAIRYLLPPPARRRRKAKYVRVGPLSAAKPGAPVRFSVRMDRWDGFTHYPPATVGQVWLIRQPDAEGEPVVRCLQTICPHMGCQVGLNAGRDGFACPCHTATFDVHGTRLDGPAPRGMDALACRVTAPDAENRRWIEVAYTEFETGTEQGRAVSRNG